MSPAIPDRMLVASITLKIFPISQWSMHSLCHYITYTFVVGNFIILYFILGFYFTGDGAYRDSDGHYQITGRIDDVINVKGHRIGTAEIESALVRGGREEH